METDSDHKTSPAAGGATGVGLLPEVEAYAYLLTVMYLVDQKEYQEVGDLAFMHVVGKHAEHWCLSVSSERDRGTCDLCAGQHSRDGSSEAGDRIQQADAGCGSCAPILLSVIDS